MRLIPKDKFGKIQFCTSHLEQWAQHAEEIGVTPEQVADLAASTQAAQEALIEQLRAQSAAQAATHKLKIALETMQTQAAGIVGIVRTQAALRGDNVYTLASIPAPAKPSPIGSPGKPTGFRVQLQETGALTLTWKCKHPVGSTGTFYEIRRRIDQGKFIRLGHSGTKRFVDQTIPPGTSSVTYRIQATRSTGNGPVAEFQVSFGTTGRMPAMRPKPVTLAA